jgi:hypothetical protein
LIGSGGVTKHKPQPRHRHMFGRLNIRWPAESVQQALSDQRDFRARLTRPLRDRSRSVLSADRRFLKRWPSSIFSTGHRFPDLASDDLGLRNRTENAGCPCARIFPETLAESAWDMLCPPASSRGHS